MKNKQFNDAYLPLCYDVVVSDKDSAPHWAHGASIYVRKQLMRPVKLYGPA